MIVQEMDRFLQNHIELHKKKSCSVILIKHLPQHNRNYYRYVTAQM
jgi:hypothetical protein